MTTPSPTRWQRLRKPQTVTEHLTHAALLAYGICAPILWAITGSLSLALLAMSAGMVGTIVRIGSRIKQTRGGNDVNAVEQDERGRSAAP